jgi:hypothetical protein
MELRVEKSGVEGGNYTAMVNAQDVLCRLSEQPSPLGRGCPAAGDFSSRSGTGEGSVAESLAVRV